MTFAGFRRYSICGAIVAAVLATTSGCSGRGSGDVVASAGDQQISEADVRKIVDSLPEATRVAVSRDRGALDRVVRAELLRRALVAEAKGAGLASDPKVAAQLERVEDDVLVAAWLARQAEVSGDYPSDEDLKLAYQANLAALTPPTEYRVAQIFISAPNGIGPAQLATAMRKAAEVGGKIPGGDFAQLAQQYSEHADSAGRGGDVGMLPADQMLPEIVAAVRGLEVGATTGPVKTSQGLHYIKLLDRNVATPPTLDDARERLTAALRAQRARELEQAYVSSLNSRLNVKVDQIELASIQSPGDAATRQ